MSIRSEAEEHLRVIRSLMERATIYRAISAEAAAVGGGLAIAGSFSMGSWLPGRLDTSLSANEPSNAMFLGTWFVILFVATLANLFFLRRSALLRGEPFFSAGMKLASGSLLPSFVVAGCMTLQLCCVQRWTVLVVPVWITCYGLALLATRHFAPRSLVWLGWSFLLAGLLCFQPVLGAAWGNFYNPSAGVKPWVFAAWQGIYTAQMLMAATFGLFHLIYAACTWPRKSATADSSGET